MHHVDDAPAALAGQPDMPGIGRRDTELPPGSTMPTASAIAVIVLAVPIVMHVP